MYLHKCNTCEYSDTVFVYLYSIYSLPWVTFNILHRSYVAYFSWDELIFVSLFCQVLYFIIETKILSRLWDFCQRSFNFWENMTKRWGISSKKNKNLFPCVKNCVWYSKWLNWLRGNMRTVFKVQELVFAYDSFYLKLFPPIPLCLS